MLLAALADLGAKGERIDVASLALSPDDGLRGYDKALVRCLNHWQALYASTLLENGGVPTVNGHEVIATCGDLMRLSVALTSNDVPMPSTRFAFSQQAALEAIEEMGYGASPIPGGQRTAVGLIGNDGRVDTASLQGMPGVGPTFRYMRWPWGKPDFPAASTKSQNGGKKGIASRL